MRMPLLPLALAVVASAAPAGAHRGHDFISVVTLQPDGVVTVSHRFEAADIEPALARIAPDAQPTLDDPEAIRGLQAYLGRRFQLSGTQGRIALTPAKVDIDAQEVRVAFTGRAPRGLTAVTVRSTVLDDVYPHQVNQVNVRRGKIVRTIAINGGEPHVVRF